MTERQAVSQIFTQKVGQIKLKDGRIIVIQETKASLQVYADRVGIKLGTIEDWKKPTPGS